MIITIDKKQYEGSPTDIVRAMRSENMFTESEPKHDYMREAAERASIFYGVMLRADTPDNFVADLVSAGIAEQVG